MAKNYLPAVILIACFAISCENKEIYRAGITVSNHSPSTVTGFTLECAGEQTAVAALNPGEQKTFTVTWVGRSSFFAASIDNSYVFLTIEYSINDKPYTVSNEKGALQDDYGAYYSTKTITNGSKAAIAIADDGYEITVQ
jgi:hypothetical protein